MRNIAVIGSLNIDVVVTSKKVPEPGETLSASALSIGAGGKGLNQAVACHRLSARNEVIVRMFGAVGDDTYGEVLLRHMNQDGLETNDVAILPDQVTGTAVVMLDNCTLQNRILVHAGANARGGEGFLQNSLSQVPDLIIMQFEIDPGDVLKILKKAASHVPPIPVLLNPAPAHRLPKEAFPLIKVLILNETEAAFICGHQSDVQVDLDLAGDFADQISAKGTQITIITLGAKGCVYVDASGVKGHQPIFPTTVVDTTAAGDTFVGALAVELVSQKSNFDLRGAVEWAAKCASVTVNRAGASASIPWAWDVSGPQYADQSGKGTPTQWKA